MTSNRENPEAALTVASVSHVCGERSALRNVTFEIAPGRFAALLGLNGAGKTTLFSLITRLLALQQGSIKVAGLDVTRMGSRALAPLGVVFQQPALDLDLSVRQNLRYFAALQGLSRASADDRMLRTLEDLAMPERIDEKVRVLNGGHRRRVEIVRALMHEPSVLLLDEATVGLDVPTRATIVDHVHNLASERGIAVLWATHLIDEIRAADDLIVLNAGQVIESGRVGEVVSRVGAADLAGAFHGLIEKDSLSPSRKDPA